MKRLIKKIMTTKERQFMQGEMFKEGHRLTPIAQVKVRQRQRMREDKKKLCE